MHSRTHLAGPVALIAEAGSALAERVAAGLEEEGLRIVRIGSNRQAPTDAAASVVLVEEEAEIDALRSTLDQVLTPALVLGATPDLVVAVLPALKPMHDLGLATDPAAVIAWRLTSLVELSRCFAAGQSQLDALTGLLNRRAFEFELRRAAESGGSGEISGLLLVNLDRFKSFNDSLGHVAGDNVLRAVGELLPRSLAPGDSVARVGGDEFACLLTRYDTESVRRDCVRLIGEIANIDVVAILGCKECPSLTASAGLTFMRPSVDLEQLMTEASSAVYEAKLRGRSQLVVYGERADETRQSSRDLGLQHFENATRLAAERLAEMITLKSRRLIEAARYEANVCSLTGLHNRRYFDAELSVEIERSRRQGCPLSLAYIDLDHFHDVNMTYGWPTGDRVLQTFASVARANVRGADSVARFGGEEFVILMPDTTLESARDVAERVRAAFESVVTEGVAGQRVKATLSVGVAQWRDHMPSLIEFVNDASDALLRAKHAGRNRVEQADA